MQQRSFGKTGLHAAPLGFGGAPIGFLKTEQEEVGAVLRLLHEHGCNLIDTAAGYEGSELLIAQEIAGKRDQFILVSKCGGKLPDVDERPWSANMVSKTVDRSLKRLRIDALDVMLLHTCTLDVLKQGEALGALAKARDAGKIRFVGYSGDNEAAAYAAALPDVAVIQTSVNLADQANIDNALPIAREHGVAVLAKRPIANAAWRHKSEQRGFYGDYAATYKQRLEKMKITPKQFGIAGEEPAAWLELALRFTLSQEGVNTAIIGTTSVENTRRNIAAAEKGPLPADVVKGIREAFAAARGSEDWSGQT